MKVKKLGIIIVLCIFAISTFSFSASAKLKDSPTKGYGMTVVKDAPYYNKVNGKKQGVIKYGFIITDSDGYDHFAPNSVEIIKHINETWVKVKFSNKYLGKTNKYGFIKKSYVRTNLDTFEYLVVNTKILNLRSKPSSKSKVLAKIPLGTWMEINYGKNERPVINHWVRVTYIKNGKKYVGFLSEKYVKY